MSGNEELFARFPCNGIPLGNFGINTDTKKEKLLAYEYFTWRGGVFDSHKEYNTYKELCDWNPDGGTVGVRKTPYEEDLTSWSIRDAGGFDQYFHIKNLLIAAKVFACAVNADAGDIL